MASNKDMTFKARVDGNEITIGSNDTTLANGDYVCEHIYHPERVAHRNRAAKMDQLELWLTTTFKYGKPPGDSEESPIHLASSLYDDEKTRDAILKLLEWLKDPKDN